MVEVEVRVAEDGGPVRRRRRRRRTPPADEVAIDLVRVRALIAEGHTDPQIAAELRVAISDVVMARRRVVSDALLEVGPNRPVVEVYTEHRLRMMHVVGELGKLATSEKSERPHITLGALRAQAKIEDQLLERGQERGVLPRAARKSSSTVAGVIGIGSMSDPEMVNHLGNLNREGKRLQNEHEDVPFLDLKAPTIYPDVIEAEPIEDVPPKVQRRKA